MRLIYGIIFLTLTQACASTTDKDTKEATKPPAASQPSATLSPRYPAYAAANGIEGYACFIFTIKADGSVADPKVYDSKPEGVFEVEATRAISKWKFRPSKVDGVPVDTPNAKYCLDFKLSED